MLLRGRMHAPCRAAGSAGEGGIDGCQCRASSSIAPTHACAQVLCAPRMHAGLVVSCIQQLCVAFAGTKPLSMAAVALGSMGNITFPAISSIKSKSVQRHEQVRAGGPCLLRCQVRNPVCNPASDPVRLFFCPAFHDILSPNHAVGPSMHRC